MATRAKQISPQFYSLIGLLLLSAGIAISLIVTILITDGLLQQQVVRRSQFLMMPGTPVFGLLPATATPEATPTFPATVTPTALPTPTSVPVPPVRIRIPYIGVNSLVVEVHPEIYTTYSGVIKARWNVPSYAVGHFFSSGNPGSGTNIVLSGHNNFLGEVFRDFYLLKAGQEVILYTLSGEYHYIITEITIVPYLRDPVGAEERLQAYMASTDHERVTLISCYPYLTNSDRIVVIAEPFPAATS